MTSQSSLELKASVVETIETSGLKHLSLETELTDPNSKEQDLAALQNIQAELERLSDITPQQTDPMASEHPSLVDVKTELVEETVTTSTSCAFKKQPQIVVASTSSSPVTHTKGTSVPIKLLHLPNNLLNSDNKLVLPESVLADLGKLQGQVYLVPSTSVGTLNISGTQTTSTSVMEPKVVKRPTMPSGQVITKVIITSNPVVGQPGTQQMCLTPVSSSSSSSSTSVAATSVAPTTFTIGGQQMKIIATTTTAQPTLMSPTKMVTINQALLNSPNKQLLTTIPGTPTKQGIVLGKIPITPNSKGTPTKIMIPVNMMKSPQRIAPAPMAAAVSGISMLSASTTTTTTTAKALSPSKVIFRQAVPVTAVKQGSQTLVGQPAVTSSTSMKQITVPISSVSGSSMQPVQVPGSKFHYVRLVTAPASNSPVSKPATIVPVTMAKPIAPATATAAVQGQLTQTTPPTMKIALPIAPVAQQTIGKVVPKTTVPQQRILIPASSVAGMTQIRSATNVSVPTNTLAPLPPGTTLISTGGNMQSFVMVPAQYVTQFQQQFSSQGAATGHQAAPPACSLSAASTPQPILPAQGSTSASAGNVSASVGNVEPIPSSQGSKHHLNGSTLESNGVRPRKPCNCTKSQCLKLYCDCFANGEFCNDCNCSNCYNNLEHEEERQKAIRACLDRNPLAFHPKIGKGKDGEHERRHNKGCNCKRSGCLKNYCECYEAKIMCSSMCKCVGCKNFEESAERKTLMHLADAAEVRVQQQTAAKNKLLSQVQDVPQKVPMGSATGERLPFSFVTPEVLQATCQCLLAQAEEGEKAGLSDEMLERLVLEEFGRCLITIIGYANRTKNRSSTDSASAATSAATTNVRSSGRNTNAQ